MSRQIRNAIIKSTAISTDRCLSCWLYLEFPPGGQGFGGFALDEWDERTKKRRGSGYGMRFIGRILEVLAVETWEKLPGTHIRIDNDWREVYRIGHFMKEQWFDPKGEKDELLKENEPKPTEPRS